MSVRHTNPLKVRIGSLQLGLVASINETSDGISNPQNINYSIRSAVVQNETFPQKTSLCAQLKGLWEITITFCTVRHEDKVKMLSLVDPDSGGGAGPYDVETELLGIKSFWLETVRCVQPNGMDPEYFQWDLTLIENRPK